MHTAKRVTSEFPRIPGRSAWRPIQSFRMAVAVLVLVLGVPAGVLGCSASPDTSDPELDVPLVFYVSRGSGGGKPESRFGLEELFGEQGSGHYTIAFDATDLRGVAELKTGPDDCPVRLPTFRCGGELVDARHGGSGQSFRVSPADGAKAGDSAVLRYRLTSPGRPSVTASTRIVVGRPALAVEARADRDKGDATYPTVTFDAAGLGVDYVPPDEIASRFESGQGSALRYVPGAGQNDGKETRGPYAAGESAAHLRLAVRSTSDLVALADTARGPVGSRADVRVGVRNDGPGALPAKVSVEFVVPAGTSVLSSPYDPERDEEVIDQVCRALAANGSPLADAYVRQPRARRYVCTAEAGKAGATTTFPFTLRIDKEMNRRGGRVTVADGDIHRPSNDPKAANDSADVAVSVWPGPAWATPGLWATAGIALGVCALVAALETWRRRRPRVGEIS